MEVDSIKKTGTRKRKTFERKKQLTENGGNENILCDGNSTEIIREKK